MQQNIHFIIVVKEKCLLKIKKLSSAFMIYKRLISFEVSQNVLYLICNYSKCNLFVNIKVYSSKLCSDFQKKSEPIY